MTVKDLTCENYKTLQTDLLQKQCSCCLGGTVDSSYNRYDNALTFLCQPTGGSHFRLPPYFV